MPYHYLEDIAIADAAFEAWGETLEEMVLAAADATMNVMVDNLESIAPRARRHFLCEDAQLDMLLFKVLQELIFFKDAERLLLRIVGVNVTRCPNHWEAGIDAAGDFIDPATHELATDVKAVTLHRLRVEQTSGGWHSTVVLDT